MAPSQFSLRMLFVLISLLAIAIPVGQRFCSYWYPAKFFNGPTATFCVIDGSDLITRCHVRNLLSHNDINSSIDYRNKMWNIIIDESELELATKLLKDSSSKNNSISISPQKSFNVLLISDKEDRLAVKHVVNRSIDDFDPSDNELITKIVLAVRDHSSSSYLSRTPSMRLPIVKSIWVKQRNCINREGRLEPAYEITIQLHDKMENPSVDYYEYYHVMDQFNTVWGGSGHGSGILPDMKRILGSGNTKVDE